MCHRPSGRAYASLHFGMFDHMAVSGLHETTKRAGWDTSGSLFQGTPVQEAEMWTKTTVAGAVLALAMLKPGLPGVLPPIPPACGHVGAVGSKSLSSAPSCRGRWIWPLQGGGACHESSQGGRPGGDTVVVTAPFDLPDRPWLPGHRGVDLAASPGACLLSPAEGRIAFAGLVAGKAVVTVRHGSLTSTYEPARTELPEGTPVRQGAPFGRVEGESDHCGDRCLHWGLLSGRGAYLDPASRLRGRRIVLKPV